MHIEKIIYLTARMNEQDLTRLLDDAQQYHHEDQKEKETILARNQLETFVQWIEYLLHNKVQHMHITRNYHNDIKMKCNEIEEWLKENKVWRYYVFRLTGTIIINY
jgi:molecular chaperone DnaK (HSP70)